MLFRFLFHLMQRNFMFALLYNGRFWRRCWKKLNQQVSFTCNVSLAHKFNVLFTGYPRCWTSPFGVVRLELDIGVLLWFFRVYALHKLNFLRNDAWLHTIQNHALGFYGILACMKGFWESALVEILKLSIIAIMRVWYTNGLHRDDWLHLFFDRGAVFFQNKLLLF